MSSLPVVYQIFIWIAPVLFAVTLHEVGHGWAAMKLGDPTAQQMGRLTINPFKHIDLIGTIIVPLISFFVSGFIFGWAKPVPVNWERLRNRRRDIALVALAGPGANLLMIACWLLLAKLFVGNGEHNMVAMFIVWMAWAGIVINSLLMILNLFPLPPLDGSRVLYSLLPGRIANRYLLLEPYGLIILIVLLFTGILFKLLGPLIFGFQSLMYQIIT